MRPVIDSTVIAAFVASATTLIGFFINAFFSKRSDVRQELKTSYGDVIASSRSIRRTLIAFHEFNISFQNMMITIRERDAETTTELDIQKQAAFNYEEKANKYRDILTEQQGMLDKAFFTIAGVEKGYTIRRWMNASKTENDKKFQAAIEKILSYKEEPRTIDDAKEVVNEYFKDPISTIQGICTERMQKL